MKTALAIALLAACCAIPAAAADLTGNWTGHVDLKTADGQSNTLVLYAHLSQKEAVITGSFGPTPTQQFILTTGAVEKAMVTFEAPAPTRVFKFRLMMATADRLEGIVESDDHKAFGPVTFTRDQAAVNGDAK